MLDTPDEPPRCMEEPWEVPVWHVAFAPGLMLLRNTSSGVMFVLLTDDPFAPLRFELKALDSALFASPFDCCTVD